MTCPLFMLVRWCIYQSKIALDLNKAHAVFRHDGKKIAHKLFLRQLSIMYEELAKLANGFGAI
jgi:hypothetical protein